MNGLSYSSKRLGHLALRRWWSRANGHRIHRAAQKCKGCENDKLRTNQLPHFGVAADRTLELAPSVSDAFTMFNSSRSKDMIAISIMCVLLICLFRLNLDEVSSKS